MESWLNFDFFVEPITKANANYYCKRLQTEMILEMNRLANHNEYLFMQDGARAPIVKLNLEILKDNKQLQLMEPHSLPPSNPDLHPETLVSGVSWSKTYIEAEG